MSDYQQGYGYGEPYDPAYGQPGGDYHQTEPLPEPPRGGSNTRILGVLGVLILACVVVLILALVGVFDSDKTAGPRTVATALLEAGKAHDVDAARKVLCEKDLSTGTAGSIASMTIQTYSIEAVSQSSDSATVTATVVNGSRNTVVPIPLVKEGGAWKVCLPIGANLGGGSSTATSSGSTGVSSPPSTPPPSTPPPSTPPVSSPVPTDSLPTDSTNFNVCQSSTNAQMTASVFVGALAIGSADLAQGCVFNNAVPAATVNAIAASDTVYSQLSTSGSTFVFQSTDGSKKLTVTVTKESDGHFYVTALVQS